ncbi:threonine synthase [Dimargaris verticillata]|uniref:threonine synthase n=1 Tax=Dimargaris verticillata TaxID=2761393 RepID=A0A9W8E9G6_9FUNG|nr:threonine synthase [Dimargaris verticillata]
MKYQSTRGGVSGYTFEQAVLEGLAPDGGLFIPQSIPELPANWATEWRDLSFEALAVRIFRLFIDESEISTTDLTDLVHQSYRTFRHPEVTPVRPLYAPDASERLWLLELFHGPTFAFKDVALQFLGNLFEYFLARRNQHDPEGHHHITVVGATSGDTGSAAIYGLRNKKNVQVFILHPKGRVSPIQEAQMTTVLDANIHNVAVQGTFDDCQDIVKALFGDASFRTTYQLGAINSINWARILAQTVYYFYSYFAVNRQVSQASVTAPRIIYTVPTGNFGDVLAGFYARQLGLPIHRLVVATNANDILYRFFATGRYEKASEADGQGGAGDHSAVKATHSPAMDILVSSNFERLLWYLAYDHAVSGPEYDGTSRAMAAGKLINDWMYEFKSTGRLVVPSAVHQAAAAMFDSVAVSNQATLDTIRKYHTSAPTKPSYLLDPHTAVGIKAAEVLTARNPTEYQEAYNVCLSTAHPAKFSGAVTEALTAGGATFAFDEVLPPQFVGLLEKPRRCLDASPGTTANVKQTIETTLASISS